MAQAATATPEITRTFTAPNGSEVDVTSAQVPTEAELRDIFKKAGVNVSTVAKGGPVVSPPPVTPKPPTGPAGGDVFQRMQDRALRTPKDLLIGAAKGAGSAAFRLGKLARDYTPIGRISDAIQPGAFDRPPAELETTSTAQSVGKFAEQAAEFAIPGAAGPKLTSVLGRAALEAAGAGGVAAAQGDEHPGRAALTAGALPLAGRLAATATPYLKSAARRSLEKVFGMSTLEPEHVRQAIRAIVPTALAEGIPASWSKWVAQTERLKGVKGKAVETTVAGPAGDAWAPIQPVIDALTDLEKKAARVMAPSPAGPIPVATKDPLLLTQVNFFRSKLQQIDSVYQGQVPARLLHDLKGSWNNLVYMKKAAGEINMRDLILNAKKRAARTTVGAIRDVLAQVSPSITEVDAAYHIANELHAAVVEAALASSGKIGQQVASGLAGAIKRNTIVGMASGATAGGTYGYERTHSLTGTIGGAITGGVAGRVLEKAIQSPAWRTLTATTLDKLANALVAQDTPAIVKLLIPVLTRTAAGGPPTPPAAPAKAVVP